MTTAILIIDVQNALFDPEPRPFDVNKVLENINSITDWARKCFYPVIYIQHEQAGSVMEYKSQGWPVTSRPDC